MMTDYIWRINVICPIENATAINALWTVIAPNGDAEAQSFGTRCSANGLLPATHYIISTAATEEMRLLLTDALSSELTGAIVDIDDKDICDAESFLTANNLQMVHIEVT